MNSASGFGNRASARPFVIPNRAEGTVRNLLSAPAHRLKAEARSPAYRNSSIAASSASLPGRVSDSGNVASGSSTIFSISRKLGDLVFT